MKLRKNFILFVAGICIVQLGARESSVSTVDSIEQKYVNWHLSDLEMDSIPGVSVSRSYKELLKGREATQKVIVAVIDAGVDINHEDLQGKIWINPDEIPGNNIDDDNNGYIDDVNGWNYLGTTEGEQVTGENLEYVRIIRKYQDEFKGISNIEQVEASKKEDYLVYQEAKSTYKNDSAAYTKINKRMGRMNELYAVRDSIVKSYLDQSSYNKADLESIDSDVKEIKKARNFLLFLWKSGLTPETVKEYRTFMDDFFSKHQNFDFTPRDIIGDDVEDINDRDYGNPTVDCEFVEHGTFVAGIIAANRNNDIGIDGIAENVEIMALRAVPNGDEYDKDIALAIRYAVDNGAKVINMSFGKAFSPQKSFVDEAVKYAEENDVLLVHAAGNESKNVDVTPAYPMDLLDNNTTVENWINVGASSIHYNKKICGLFSNYGKSGVDIFAPGVNTVSLYPDNTYKKGDGTSFACPMVSGVAALVWSYYPNLTAKQVKEIIMESAYPFPGKKVIVPNEKQKKKKIKSEELSVTNGLLNAYAALKLAEEKYQ
ncbi:MAG: S8 family peptidase [Bacteroidales bacterium]|nr:S8 family peptidase [Bacteroidales bacterium]